MRIILATIFTGQAVSFIYSVSGGFLCLIVMAAVNKLLRGQYIFLTGILGAVSHNAGQILAAFFILRLSGIFAYMPFLVISGVITGLFTGLVCFFADRYIQLESCFCSHHLVGCGYAPPNRCGGCPKGKVCEAKPA